jgi:hypothetical protein
MRLSDGDARKFPKFKQYLHDALPKVVSVPVIVKSMEEIGQINKARLTKVLKFGQGPQVTIVKDLRNSGGKKVLGLFKPAVGSNEIKIDEDMVKEFEAGRGLRTAKAGKVYLVGVTVLHELIHWGDDQDGIDRPGEEGAEFEKKVYGSVIV